MSATPQMGSEPPSSASNPLALPGFLQRGPQDGPQPQLKLIAGDGSDRKFWRLEGSPTKAIRMVFTAWEGNFGGDPESWLKMHAALEAAGMPLPKILEVAPADLSIWIEDLGDRFLADDFPGGELGLDSPAKWLQQYRKALELLLVAQYPAALLPHHPAEHLFFNVRKLMYEMHFFLKHMVHTHLGWDIPMEGDASSPLLKEFESLCRWLEDRPMVLCHRDYHRRNIMIRKGEGRDAEELVWIDFQDARMGPHTYDVASLLRDSYLKLSAPLRQALLEEHRINTNRAREKRGLRAFTRVDYESEFVHMALQRNIKALGSFGYLTHVKKRQGYLGYVPRTLEALLNCSSEMAEGAALEQKYPLIFDLLRRMQDLPTAVWRDGEGVWGPV